MSESGDEEADRRADLGRKALAGILLAIVSVRLGPDAQVIAAGVGPYAEEAFGKVIAEWRRDGTRRTEEMIGYACETAGEDPDQFASRAGATEETRRFTANAAAGAFNTTWEPKIRALGRLLAQGLLADGDKIDLREHALPAMMDMERLHVSLLELLVKYQPSRTAGSRDIEPFQDYLGPAMTDWHTGKRRWTGAQISSARPELAQVLPGLLGTLQRHGLAIQNDTSPETVTRSLKEVVRQYDRDQLIAGASKSGRPVKIKEPRVPQIDPTWSPTEFGERVLGFYAEAAAENDINHIPEAQRRHISRRPPHEALRTAPEARARIPAFRSYTEPQP